MTTEYSDGKIAAERFAPHLSEFYPLVNSSGQNVQDIKKSEVEAPTHMDRLESPFRSAATSSVFRLRRPSSFRSGFSTISDLQNLVTNKDMTQTVDTMQQLLANAKSYAKELSATSQKASLLALSLEQMARLKGCNDDSADKYLSSSGLFHLIANHQRIMSNCISSSLVETLTSRIDEFQYKRRVHESEFKREFHDEAKKLKLQEKYNAQFSRRKTRNLVSYRENLANLQLQLDELESLKHHYYQNSYEMVESCCSDVLKDTATVSRAQVEISENIARKGWSGGGLDELLVNADDPFNNAGSDQKNEDLTYEYHSDVLNSPRSSHISRNGTPRTAKLRITPSRRKSGSHSSASAAANQDSDNDDAYDNSFSLPMPKSQEYSLAREGEGKKSDTEVRNNDEEEQNNDGNDKTEGLSSERILDGLTDLKLDTRSSKSSTQ
ncbi:LAME_0D08570g1_1 [Lachancea meyersii CBS 8951]|uniref:LAME_0D08570g1_1 n=1 Tax=Lachancea meyersii CBS 8951 TaxID=1266667 RepID=A0A1G4JAS6_9SACH|nr:LAME_0D08570g1_1 [Lachancea meyersii CBS 8951]